MHKYALLSVSDKSGLVSFARNLVDHHSFTLLSTGGTAQLLREEGIPVTDVSDRTGFPEMMDGRVKTLHPKVHGGLLCLRDNPEHIKAAEEHDIAMIDLVVVNLYPFEETVARANVSFEDAIEQIDIGGPSMLRSAAKNHRDVTVVCDPGDYDRVLGAMSEGGEWGRLRKELALKVFQRTSSYDKAISDYFSKQVLDEPDMESISGFPSTLDFQSKKSMSLRYGENPHQQAALYGDFLDYFDQLQGKELSYNNILDISASAYLIGEFERPTVAILKHTNPCGVASAEDLETAWDRAYSTDQQAPFGGIIVVNNTLDIGLARKISEIFCEVIIAPGFTEEALAGLNDDARGIILVMINTGARPSELAALHPEEIRLDGPVPHLAFAPVERQLKTSNAMREIPLVGVSLRAMRKFPGGFPRYRGNSAALSSTANKGADNVFDGANRTIQW